MWTKGETKQLTVERAERSWLNDTLLTNCDFHARELRVTGTQTLATRTPSDEESDYLCFDIVLNSVHASGVSFGFDLDETSPHANRTATIAEAIAELAHAAAYGDSDADEALIALLGIVDAGHLGTVAAAHP